MYQNIAPTPRTARRRLVDRALRLAAVAAVTGCSTWAFATLDLALVKRTMAQADLVTVLGFAPALLLAVWGLRALRWRAVLSHSGASLDLFRLYLQTCVSLGISAVTPAQTGEFVKIAYAQQTSGISAGQAAGAFVVERVAEQREDRDHQRNPPRPTEPPHRPQGLLRGLRAADDIYGTVQLLDRNS